MLENVKIEVISQYGGIKIKGSDKWLNAESPDIQKKIKNSFKQGDVVHIGLSADNKICMIEKSMDEIIEVENIDSSDTGHIITIKERMFIRQNACRHASSMIDVLQRQGEFETKSPRDISDIFFVFAEQVEEWITRK